MHIATSYTYHSPEMTKFIVIGVSCLLTVVLGTYFVVAFRRNQRGGSALGELTPAERSVNRIHAVAIMGVLVGSMALAVGSVVSPAVRDALSTVGDHSRRLPLLLIPVVVLYGRWLTRRSRVIARERAALTAERTVSSTG